MNSTLSHTVRESFTISVQNHPFHPTTADDLRDYPIPSHGSATPWGPAHVASCVAGLSDRDMFSGVVGEFINTHEATSRSKGVSFESIVAAAPSVLNAFSNLDVYNQSAALPPEVSA